MKVFISGPLLTKTKEANIKAYLDAARAINGQGHTALYPFDITLEENDCCNRKNIRKHLQLLLKADVVLFLYNWYNDARCRIINSVATEMGVPIFTSIGTLKLLSNAPAKDKGKPADENKEFINSVFQSPIQFYEN